MGKPTGFMDYQRVVAPDTPALERVRNAERFHEELDDERRTQQAGRCMDCGVPFCQAGLVVDRALVGCPLRNLIPEWNDQLWSGQLARAAERLLRTNCFPEFTGYVCPAPCEAWCAAAKTGAAVTINDNERYIIEEAFREGLVSPRVPSQRSGARVAVVGSGPAGLTVADLLNQRGHAVTVFERDKTPGGLLVYGIPNMKLPKDVVARRIRLMREEGVAFECGVDVGRDVSVSELQGQYDAVVLAVGAQEPRAVPFEGEANEVCFALDYLGAAASDFLGEAKLPASRCARGKVVAVVGAGDSANDCIATALRQGAKDVVQLIRRPAEDYGDATDYAHEEASAVLGRDIRLFQTQVRAVRADKRGHLRELVLSTPEGEKACRADMLVVASGFKGPEAYAAETADEAAGNLFRAGDANLGASLVVRAMADARKTAAAVDAHLMGYTTIA